MGRNLLKNGYWLIDDDISCLDQLWSFGAIDLIPCKNSVKDSCKVALIPSPYDSFHAYNKKRRKPFVRDSHRMHTEDTPSGRHRCRLMQMTEVDGRHRKHEVENSNWDSLLDKEEVLLFLSLMWHWCITYNLELITNVYNPCRVYYYFFSVFICMIFCLNVCLCTIFIMPGAHRPEEDGRSPGVVCHHLGTETCTQVLCKCKQMLLGSSQLSSFYCDIFNIHIYHVQIWCNYHFYLLRLEAFRLLSSNYQWNIWCEILS